MRTAAALCVVASCAVIAQESTLPNAETFLAAARENMSRADRVDHLYAFKERRTDVHTNPFGRIGTGGTRVFEVYPSPTRALTYRRLIERNGVAVPAPELAQQDREYRTRVSEQLKAPPSAADRASREQGARQRSESRIDDIVQTLDFKVQGRTTLDSVRAILVTFSPKPQAKPRTREGRIAQKFNGKIWIHEAASEVMRVEATATDDITFGFGLVARLGQGTTALLLRRPVEGGVWMPTELRLNGQGRAALFRRLVIDFTVQWFDYKRLNGESLTPFLDTGI